MQGSIKILTYSVEFDANKIGIEEILGLQEILCKIGFIIGTSCVLCDNATVVTSATNVNGLLKFCLMALSYHLTREIIIAGIIEMQYVTSGKNVSY